MLLIDPLASLKEQQVSWSSPPRAHAAMAFTATIIMNIRWESSGVRNDQVAVHDGVHRFFSMFIDEDNSSLSRQLGKLDSSGNAMEISENHKSDLNSFPLVTVGDSTGRFNQYDRSSARRPYRRVLRRGLRSYRTTSKLAALALIPFLPITESKRQSRLGHIAQPYQEQTVSLIDRPISPPQITTETAVSDDRDCTDAAVVETLNLETEKKGIFLLSAAVMGTIVIGFGSSQYSSRSIVVPLAVLLFIPAMDCSESAVPELHLQTGRSSSPVSTLKPSRERQNLSGARSVGKPHGTADSGTQLPSQRPRSGSTRPGGAHANARRKNWATHVSTAYMVRKHQLLGIWVGILLISCAIYWFFLREHIPPVWAAAFCFLIFIIGFLYNSESNNIVNEVLTFVSGMTVFGIYRMLSHRKVLHRCQCRMCDREVNISTKLGEGSFGAVYKARTTHRSSEGAGVTCVVKRVPVDLETDINDGKFLASRNL